MTIWLVEQSKFAEMRKAYDAGLFPSAVEQSEYEARCDAEFEARGPRSLNVAGNVAEIRVEGLLTERPSLFALIFGDGNTTYRDIRAALAEAMANAAITRVQFIIASPGGTVDGLFETLASIEATGKPMSVSASHATSAAYAIAAVAGRITASTAAATFGSIGVVASFLNFEEVIDITNTESPNKRPDLTTDEGKRVVREYLDGLYEVFADAIARGRGTTVKAITQDYGRGSLFAAKEAKRRGMIDAIPRTAPGARAVAHTPGLVLEGMRPEETPSANPAPVATTPATPADPEPQPAQEPPRAAPREQPTRRRTMDLATFKAENPALYAQIVAEGDKQGHERGLAEGIVQGREKERSRVNAHLKLGKAYDAMDVAMKGIADGTSTLDEEVRADYDVARENKRERGDRQAETDGAATTGSTVTPEKDEEDLIADALDAMDGKTTGSAAA